MYQWSRLGVISTAADLKTSTRKLFCLCCPGILLIGEARIWTWGNVLCCSKKISHLWTCVWEVYIWADGTYWVRGKSMASLSPLWRKAPCVPPMPPRVRELCFHLPWKVFQTYIYTYFTFFKLPVCFKCERKGPSCVTLYHQMLPSNWREACMDIICSYMGGLREPNVKGVGDMYNMYFKGGKSWWQFM